MKQKFFLAAMALVALASCSDESFVGDNSPNGGQNGAIAFGGGFKAVTRGDTYGAAAADLLGNQFIVTGVKAKNGTPDVTTSVFPSYTVKWTANTAGKTESNTSDWEYVMSTGLSAVTSVTFQSIKFWDYSQDYYDFAAYSVGKGNTLAKLPDTPSDPAANTVQGTAISYPTGYQLKGAKDDLAECYITDMTKVAHGSYGGEVTLNFRSLATKVRMAIYETVPGYSVKDVKFYSADQNPPISVFASSENATLIGSAFYSGGLYTVSFPVTGSANDGSNTDFNKAHVTMTTPSATNDNETFGGLATYAVGEGALASDGVHYLKRTASDPSYYGDAGKNYYTTILPKEDGTVLEMCVDYTLVSIDGSGENTIVRGAKAFVPAVYTKWLPNYAYTYIFKISNNTSGWTNPNGTDPAGLFPITFDAVVLDPQISGTQSTITTVSTPSITTYQKNRALTDEVYDNDNGPIYVMVQDAALKTNLNTKGQLYSVDDITTPATVDISEATVMDALNIHTATTSETVTGRNGLILTKVSTTLVEEIAASDATDGNAVPVTLAVDYTSDPGTDAWNAVKAELYKDKACTEAAPSTWASGTYYRKNTAAKITSPAAGTYAYVYEVSDADNTNIYSAEKYASQPADWTTSGIYYEDPNGTKDVTADPAASFNTDIYYYKKYVDQNTTYVVKIITIVD